jgi:DNA-binding ferritin-like protein
LFFTTTELSPPPKPYDSDADPAMKAALEMIRIAEEAVDEAVNKLMNEVAEKILKEDWILVY